MERKKKGKDEGKRKREEKEKKIILFDVFGYKKERKEKKNVRVLSFPYLFAKRREKKNACFYLCALINDMKIHILEEQSLARLQPYSIK